MDTGGSWFNAGGIARHLLAAAALLLAVQATDAEASPKACRQIEAQLASLSKGSAGSPAAVRRYDDAIARQQQQMQKARGQARQAGCGRAISGSSVAFCASVNASMDRMQRNLADLQARRAKLGGTDTRRQRARLQASLDANGCRSGGRARVEQAAVSPNRSGQPESSERGQRTPANLRGSYRTMCVRTCDGYYFPISNATPQTGFERDQRACEAMCPGTAVELYYHRMAGEESEDMVSAVTGQPYKQMSTAFLYRKQNASVAPSCGCNAATNEAARGFQVIGGDYGSEGAPQDEVAATAAIPRPSSRPDPADDPETLASREGGLSVEALQRILAAPRPVPGTSAPGAERPVRVVGPVFLPDPEEAIDLRVQVPARDR